MIYSLSEQDANKVVNLKDIVVVKVPDVMPAGTVFILFNNSDKFITIERQAHTTYLSSSVAKRTHIEFPPRCLVNVLFVDDETAVVSRSLT